MDSQLLWDIIVQLAHTMQMVFIGESAVDSLINIYVDVLNSLDPSFNQCIDAALKQVQDKLTFLHDVKQVSKQFAENLWNVIEQSSSGKTDASKVEALTKTIYRHLVVYVCKYAAYEQASLVKHLNTLHCMKDELPDTIQALGLSANQVMDHALEARKRCQQFTENCGFCGLLIALRA
ncbi:hypothetical protein HUJ04_010068 [Dendroctonus ponderosae]|nr:hypothetical protein HUJ04_010068 [Dendroctonus ponderosae]